MPVEQEVCQGSSQSMCPGTRVPAQRQQDSGEGNDSLGINNIGNPTTRMRGMKKLELLRDF